MKQLFEDAIKIDKIGNYDRENLRFEIAKAKLSGDKPVLNIPVKLNFIIPYDEHLKIKAIIKNKLPGIADVKLSYEYEDIMLSREDCVRLAIPHIIEEINGSYAAVTKTIRTDEYSLRGS